MATGVNALEQTLIGQETTPGTGVATTTHWRGVGKSKNRLEQVFPPERVGKIGGTTRSYIPKTGGEVTLEGDATFQQLPYIKNAGIYTTVPTTDASSAFIWTWNVQYNSSDPLASTDITTLTIETGDNINVDKHTYCFVREYTESGKMGEGLQVSATLQSRAPSTASSFSAVGDTDLTPDPQVILASMVTLSIDDATGTAGATTVTETYLAHTLKHTTGWVATEARDGRLDFSSIKHIDDEIMLDLTFEHSSFAETEKAAWVSGTERVIRLHFAGSALTTTNAGATYDTFAYRMTLYGKWVTFGAEGLEEQNGDNIYKGTFRCAFSSAAGAKATFVIANETQTLP